MIIITLLFKKMLKRKLLQSSKLIKLNRGKDYNSATVSFNMSGFTSACTISFPLVFQHSQYIDGNYLKHLITIWTVSPLVSGLNDHFSVILIGLN